MFYLVTWDFDFKVNGKLIIRTWLEPKWTKIKSKGTKVIFNAMNCLPQMWEL